jgi:hypothetical protein
MFERFTELARQALFHARHEATQSPTGRIELAHLALGVLTADKELRARLLGSRDQFESLRRRLADQMPVSADIVMTGDLPLSDGCLQVLCELPKDGDITPIHLLKGLFGAEPTWTGRTLHEFGITAESVAG